MASELGAGTPNHVPIHSGENLSDGGHQACLNVIGMSIGMIIKFALDKIAHQLKILDVLWPKSDFFQSQVFKRPDDP